MRRRTVAALVAASGLAASAPSLTGVAAATTRLGRWSAPAVAEACPAVGAPHVLYPSDRPDHASGPGALVWSAARGCSGGEGARVAALGAAGIPAAPLVPHTAAGRALTLRGPISAAVAPRGRILIAAAQPGTDAVAEGASTGPFAPLAAEAGTGAPLALASAYLGDVAMLARTPAGGTRMQLQRYFAERLAGGQPVAAGPGVRASTLALDYRTDAIAAWAQGESVYARDLPATGPRQPVQRLGPSGPHPHIVALISDDHRAIVAWSEDRAGVTSVWCDRSAGGVRFGTPSLIERFADPPGRGAPAASPRLIRLSSESVMLAWTGAGEGHWTVRAAAVDLRGVGPATTISKPGADARLAALAPGPAGEALALWTQPDGPAGRDAPFAARGVEEYPQRVLFGSPEAVATGADARGATLAIDPVGGLAVAAWRGASGSIEYSIRAPATP